MQLVALVVDHDNVVLAPALMVDGLAPKTSVGGGTTVMVTLRAIDPVELEQVKVNVVVALSAGVR